MKKTTPEAAPAPEPEETPADLLELVLAEHEDAPDPSAPAPAPEPIHGVVIGVIAGLGPDGDPIVAHGLGEPRAARSMIAVSPEDVGREAAIVFERGDRDRPVLMGLMHAPAAPAREAATVKRDGERVVISAEQEITFECGKSSITLTRAGKILIRGAYVLSRSSGVNRIQGGSVEIN